MRRACSAFIRKKRAPEKRDQASHRSSSRRLEVGRADGSGSANPVAARNWRASRRPKPLRRAAPRGSTVTGSSLPV